MIRQPDGSPLPHFKRGPGPHTGVHLILVRHDLAYLIHRHPPIAADGTISQPVTFPAPGVYRLVVDVYPASGSQVNFQLFGSVRVAGSYRPQALPASTAAVTVGGYRFTLHGASHLKAIQAALVTVDVTGPQGAARALHAVVRRARPRDLLPARARSTTSTPTSARPAPAAARACSAARR